MRIGNTKTRVFLYLFLLTATFFYFAKNILANTKDLIISEILIDSKNGEFVELYNSTDHTIDLGSYYFTYYSSKKDWGEPYRKQKFPDSAKINSNSFYLIGLDNFNTTNVNWSPYSSPQLSNSAGSIAIFPNDTFTKTNALDAVAWGKVEIVGKEEEISIPKTSGNSLERISPSGNTWQESFCFGGSPGKSNAKQEDCPKTEPPSEPTSNNAYAGKLKITEIFPAPKNKRDGKEFVEIKNISDENIDLSGMHIEDEKNHKVSLPDKTLKAKTFFVLEGNFEFNNTSADSAFLIDKDDTKENAIDSVHYEKPKYDYAYAWNGTAWQWTSKETPGAENQFDELLSGKIERDEKIYVNMYANFSMKTNDKAQKFTWNFGDGHKSYKKETRHKYTKTGTYNASLKITGDGEENILNFEIEVEKFEKTKVRIVSLSPNPKDKDAKNEWIKLKNETKKKINLKNWSVATGTKKLTNHPIKKDFILKAGQTKKLKRSACAFSLGNKKAKIELRYPDGEVADKVNYDLKKGSVTEDELYQKEKDGWQWTGGQNKTSKKTNAPKDEDVETEITPEETQHAENTLENIPEQEKENTDPEETLKEDIDLSLSEKYSENPAWKTKQEKRLKIIFAGSNIQPTKSLLETQARVLGDWEIKPNKKDSPEKIILPKTETWFWQKVNAKLNWLVGLF